jgi:hypothetical protein
MRNASASEGRSNSVCRLCGNERELRLSHFMPAALYPRNKKKIFMTRTGTIFDPDQITARLLCDECEERFNKNGENEVLRWMAPKAKKSMSPLYQALQTSTPVWTDADLKCHWGSSLGISPEKFVYFALSLIWRASASDWQLPNGVSFTAVDLRDYLEPIRLYLVGQATFPDDVSVMITVCSDDKSQEFWSPPQVSPEHDALVVAPVIGVLFRIWLGRVLPPAIHRTLFYPADGNPIFTTHCWDILSQTLSELANPPD